jgi:hypothetical protein
MYINHKLLEERFKSEVLEKLVPGIDHVFPRYYSSSSVECSIIDLCNCNKHYENSPFFFNEEKELIHFTSFEALKAILASNTLRLYNLKSMEDKEEFAFASNLLELNPNDIEKGKEDVFISCFNKKDSINSNYMWEKYGRNHEGVAIEISFQNQMINWSKFQLACVNYNDIHPLLEYRKAKSIFDKAYSLNVIADLTRFLSFFKIPDLKKENEIRLQFFDSSLDSTTKLKRVKRDSKKKFIQIQLSNNPKFTNDLEKHWFQKSPQPKIAKIYLGKKFENEIKVINSHIKGIEIVRL